MFKKLFLLILSFLLISVCHSYVNVSNCQIINEGLVSTSSERIVLYNGSVSNDDVDCFEITASNFTFNCQNRLIDGDGDSDGSGIYLNNVDDVSITNCQVNQFRNGIFAMDSNRILVINYTAFSNSRYAINFFRSNNSNFENLLISGGWYSYYSQFSHNNYLNNFSFYSNTFAVVDLNGGNSNTTFTNFNVSDAPNDNCFEISSSDVNIINGSISDCQESGIFSNGEVLIDNVIIVNSYDGVDVASNSIINDVIIYNTSIGISVKNNLSITNSQIYNNTINIELLGDNSTISNNYLGNFSKIINGTSWDNVVNTTFSQNTYLENSTPSPPCFDPGNLICEFGEIVNTMQFTSLFPFISFKSLFVIMFIIMYFLY